MTYATFLTATGSHSNLFRIDSNTGSIYTNSPLTSFNDTEVTLWIEATDNGGKSGNGIAIVNVIRNMFCPRFSQTVYTTQIPENLEFGEAFLTITATDRDTQAPFNVLDYRVSTCTGFGTRLYIYKLSYKFYLVSF